MGDFISTTPASRREMLETLGLGSLEELYRDIPAQLILKDGANLPEGKSEFEVFRQMESIAAKNTIYRSVFRGAGAYRRYIPAIVNTVISKETFLTAYTPYQAEISQGILQSIFEYQTMICLLTGMDVSNASLYDGANAAAEAVAMCRGKKREKALVSACASPDVIETVRTYCWASGIELELIPEKDGVTEHSSLEAMISPEVCCVYLQQPNYYGLIEDCQAFAETAHLHGAKFIMGVDPIAAAVLKTPGECGADIAVGEGQSLGLPTAFGGPYLGFIASTEAMKRALPGRIVGETIDSEGNRAFVLTLQAREQHIRREKAGSNVCSNQALCAMAAAVYMAAMGPDGLKRAAELSLSKAHYLADKLGALGFELKYKGEFFQEFVTVCPPGVDETALLKFLEASGILGGLPVSGGLLWCTTEMNTKGEIDELVERVSEFLKKGGAAQ
ncbi:MAG: aminomethyl-transferring glycine dehydrogenase subunit GcvPA [Oscillospiraceae bacterium]|jgi:glycine dehydrogenase subunit 1|nr:aminomethyl-transferring glycine dehydrogenase subunit GcvPA [Oscillospiraceae bacterium]